MTNSLRLFLLILIVATAAQLVLPWWSITPIALVLAFVLGRRGWGAFLAGFAGVGLGWLALASWLNIQNEGHLSHRVAELIPLGGNGWLLVLVTAVLGGLVGGLAALAGVWLRQAIAKNSQTAST
ncbi:hypothetical protein [Hymenobacter sp. HDW8]|uniref:hypothetical protein n=1 Tax=Hymenobacter sp. HDW8 TaxID=2714932 RepID=UPI00140DBEAF|nr:hypothetical protein [Hymenobacter sp. HDW8]QIL76290.1 hypothetical protein G7064_10790 [Hymenobacter sp. HDW8]